MAYSCCYILFINRLNLITMINKETLEMRQEWAQSRMKDLTKFIKDNGWNENAMIKARLLAEDLNMINNLEHLLKCDSQM